MSRPSVVVRDATVTDLPALEAMWDELRELGSRIDRLVPPSDAGSLQARLEQLDRDPETRALVAVVDDEVAGMVVLTSSAFAPLLDLRAVHTHYLHVRDGFRKRGVGKALLASAVTFADEVGAEHVVTDVLPQMRDTQRWYARLGFGPVVVRRTAPVHVLRRRLAGAAGSGLSEHLVARRRSLRRLRAAATARTAD